MTLKEENDNQHTICDHSVEGCADECKEVQVRITITSHDDHCTQVQENMVTDDEDDLTSFDSSVDEKVKQLKTTITEKLDTLIDNLAGQCYFNSVSDDNADDGLRGLSYIDDIDLRGLSFVDDE